MQGELILAMTYGYEPQGRTDRKVEVARKFSDFGSEVGLPGALLVNDIPLCMCHVIFQCGRNFVHDHNYSASHPLLATLVELQATCSFRL
jgi:hypothetical protein